MIYTKYTQGHTVKGIRNMYLCVLVIHDSNFESLLC